MFEGMEESGSDGMDEAIHILSKEDKFLFDVDFFCISDNYWLGAKTPCLTYGLRGLAYFSVSVKCCEQDLHSGVLGGTVHESMIDLVQLMSSLIDSQGKILVPGIMDDVAPVTPGKTAFVLFYHVHMCVRCEVLVIWLLHLSIHAFICLPLQPTCTNICYVYLSSSS